MTTRHAFIGAVLVLGIIVALVANVRDTRTAAQIRLQKSGTIVRQLTAPSPVAVEQMNPLTPSQPG